MRRIVWRTTLRYISPQVETRTTLCLKTVPLVNISQTMAHQLPAKHLELSMTLVFWETLAYANQTLPALPSRSSLEFRAHSTDQSQSVNGAPFKTIGMAF